MYRIYENHGQRLPYIRIRSLELTNFKGVGYGKIEFNCAKESIPYGTASDILGLYGQNGSGKSSLVEALHVIKGIMAGFRMGPDTSRYIDVLADYASIRIEFDFQYTDGRVAVVSYETKIKRSTSNNEEADSNTLLVKQKEDSAYDEKSRLCIYDEIIKTDMYQDGSIGRSHTIVDTKENLLCGNSIEGFYYDKNNLNAVSELVYLKRKLFEDSYSFVFSNAVSETLNDINTEDNCSKYYEILSELQLFARGYLFVIGTKYEGLLHSKIAVPIHIPYSAAPILINDDTRVETEYCNEIEKTVDQINSVLCKIIPGIQAKLKITPTVLENGDEGRYVRIMSVRGDREFPFNYESDGIIKIFSILADYIFAFNQGSATLVVDEMDSGVFEFLLGELLQIFEQSGKGQLIFTSHNLRPLEVIDKKFIRFTTTNPENRYYKLKNVNATNNLRDVYLKEIQLGNQDEEVYKKTKTFKIVKALRDAREEQDVYDN